MGMFLTLPNFDSTLMVLCPHPPPLAVSIETKFNLGEFAHATRVFVPLAPILAFLKRVSVLLALHPLDIDLPYSNSLLNFQSIQTLSEFF